MANDDVHTGSGSAMDLALKPFGISLRLDERAQVAKYMDLLMRWSRVVNLTAIREPTEVLQRHFGESMYLAQRVELRGALLDVGSGAGFPGLALKIACPEVAVTLLEPVGKKRAFLKEVARSCQLENVRVLSDRIERFCQHRENRFDYVTLRAVGSFDSVLPAIARCLVPTGRACLWLTAREARDLAERSPAFTGLFAWDPALPVPLSHGREIWCGGLCHPEGHVSRET